MVPKIAALSNQLFDALDRWNHILNADKTIAANDITSPPQSDKETSSSTPVAPTAI